MKTPRQGTAEGRTDLSVDTGGDGVFYFVWPGVRVTGTEEKIPLLGSMFMYVAAFQF